MKIAQLMANEQDGLKALHEYHILDSLPETDFDDITQIATTVCRTPLSLVSIIDDDRQQFKSRLGIITLEMSRHFVFRVPVLTARDEITVIPDLEKDERFRDCPFVAGEPYVAFYAGIPLINLEGYSLGTLCVWDKVPGKLDDKQICTLKCLARQIVSQLEGRKKIAQLKQQQAAHNSAYQDLERFSYIASHDLKGPLNNIISLTQLLKDEYGLKLDANGNEYINYLNGAAGQLSDLVTGILNYSRSTQILVNVKEDIDVAALLEEITGLLKIPANTTISYSCQKGFKYVYTSRIALKQILMNLLHNAIKYNDKERTCIEVILFDEKHTYAFEIKDNGPGIADENKERIFDLFQRANNNVKNGDGLGIGLAIVKKLSEKLGGGVAVRSEPGAGASFILTIPK